MLLCVTVLWAITSGCMAANHQPNPVIKTDDPLASENERDFTGLVLTYFALREGESTLIRFPNGKKLLVDTGSANDANTLISLLQERHVTKLDYVLISNDLPEYAGGYARLADRFQIETVILPELTSRAIRQVVPLRSDVNLVLWSRGNAVEFDKNVVLTVLQPEEPLFLSPQDNSLVFQLRHDKLHFMFTGGIGEQAEERLVNDRRVRLKAEVLKVSRGGSNQASSEPFLTAVDPQVAVIQSGVPRDRWNAGQEEVWERLSESWVETYVTSQNGTITILSNGRDYKVIAGKK